VATMITHVNTAQIRVARRSQTYWRVTIDNPPINVMGPQMVQQFQEVIGLPGANRALGRCLLPNGLYGRVLVHAGLAS
jgi:hypothetical protein